MIAICSTGGTIVSIYDENETGLVSGGVKHLAMPGTISEHDVKVMEFGNVGSPNITFDNLVDWGNKLHATLNNPDVQGAVVAMGTNGIEEASFFLDLVGNFSKPVVVTGAMNAPGHILAEGAANLADCASLIEISSPQLAKLGVVVVMNSRIHSSTHVRKLHSNLIEAFDSVSGPVLGEIISGATKRVHYSSTSSPNRLKGRFASVLEKKVTWPDVWSINIGLDANSSILESAIDGKVDAIVITGFPSGELSENLGDSVQKAIDSGIKIVAIPRAPEGHLTAVYGGSGQGAWLQARGVHYTSGLGAAKTRILVSLAIASGQSVEEFLEAIH